MLIALTREVSPAMARCQLTLLEREPIDLHRARAQHAAYEAGLTRAGCRVERLAAGPDMPDSVFIEDTAVVFDEIAVVTRPGAPSRQGETAAVADALRPHRRLFHVDAPGTVDGGDVLVVGRACFVGRSSRTNDPGIAQLRGVLAPYGYHVTTIEVRGCLHLKSAATAVGDDLLLVNSAWLPSASFGAFDRIDVHADEPAAANALRVGGQIIYPASFPRTRERLERRGLRVLPVDASEVAKAEGAVTCCSLIFESEDLRI
jgi:dimethylargininase